jgi:hypothetical protein
MQSLEKSTVLALDRIFLFLRWKFNVKNCIEDGEDGREGVTRKMQNALRACQET